MEFPRFQWWALPLWGGKDKERENVSDESSSNPLISDYGYGFGIREPDTVKFPLRGARVTSSSPRKIKKKWHSREERRIDREHDIVVVPTDGVCLSGSGSESEDSDWSIGWLEPHGPDFLSDDETDDSFAVLVPCYRRGPIEGANSHVLNAIKGLANEHLNDGQNLTEQWLSSLHNF